MLVFKIGDKMPGGAKEFRSTNIVEMVQILVPFECEITPGISLEGRAGDWLTKDPQSGFRRVADDYFQLNYEPVDSLKQKVS